MKNIVKILTVVLAVAFLQRDSFAQIHTLQLTEGKGYRLYPSSAESVNNDYSEGSVICWIDMKHGGSLYVQKVLNDGSIAWKKGGVVADTGLGSGFSAGDDYPMIFTDGAGGCIVIYKRDYEICAAKISAKGIPEPGPAILSSFYEGYNMCPKAKQNSELEIFVFWENFDMGDFNIHAQALDRQMQKKWNSGNELEAVSHISDQRKPELGILSNGTIVLTWLDTRNVFNEDSSSYDAYAKLFERNGNALSTDSGEVIHRHFITYEEVPHFGNYVMAECGNCPPVTEKVMDYNHRPVVSGTNFFITAEENQIRLPATLHIKLISSKLMPVWQMEFDSQFRFESLGSVADDSKGVIAYWGTGESDGHRIYSLRVNEHGKPVTGDDKQIELTCNLSKQNTIKQFGGSNSPAIFNSATQNFCLPWVAGNGGTLYLQENSLTDGSGICQTMHTVNNGLALTGHTSITTQEGKLVLVYNLAQDIFVSVRELPQDDNSIKVMGGKIANFPNPFNPVTSIYFSVPDDGSVRLSVYDLAGRRVSVLADDFFRAGEHKAVFDGRGLSSGTYIYRLESRGKIMTGKMLMVK